MGRKTSPNWGQLSNCMTNNSALQMARAYVYASARTACVRASANAHVCAHLLVAYWLSCTRVPLIGRTRLKAGWRVAAI